MQIFICQDKGGVDWRLVDKDGEPELNHTQKKVLPNKKNTIKTPPRPVPGRIFNLIILFLASVYLRPGSPLISLRFCLG
jgi:hypothetical protein